MTKSTIIFNISGCTQIWYVGIFQYALSNGQLKLYALCV
jgi:hypothetical protein